MLPPLVEVSRLSVWIDGLILALQFGFVLLLATKLLDVVSTLKRIRNVDDETNPLAHSLMRRFGVRGGVAVVMGVYLAICALSYVLLLVPLAKWRELVEMGEASGYYFFAYHVTMGMSLLLVSLVQAAVAHHNWSGRSNRITRIVARLHAAITARLHRSRFYKSR